MRGTKPKPSLTRIIPALVHIQAHLDQDLSLDPLADEVRLPSITSTNSSEGRPAKHRSLTSIGCGSNGRPSNFAFAGGRVGNRVGMRLPESRDVQPGVSRSVRHVAARLSTAVVSSGGRHSDAHDSSARRTRRHTPALDNSHRAARPHDRRIHSSSGAVRTSCRPIDFKRLTAWTSPHAVAGRRCSWASRTMRPASRRPGRFGSTAVFRFPHVRHRRRYRLSAHAWRRLRRSPNTWARGTCASLRDQFSNVFDNNPALEIIGLPAIEIYQTTRIGQRDALAQVSIAIPVKSRRGASSHAMPRREAQSGSI